MSRLIIISVASLLCFLSSRALATRTSEQPTHPDPLPPLNWTQQRSIPPLANQPGAEPIVVAPAAASMGTLSESDRHFIEQAATQCYADMLVARLASDRAGQGETRELALHISRDAAAALTALRSLVEPRQVKLPSHADERARNAQARLARLAPSHLDREYLRLQLESHISMTAVYRRQADVGHDALLRSWAATRSATFERHMQALRDLLAERKPGV